MSLLSINDAAKLCGKARSTMQRHVRNGLVPVTEEGLIDTAELVRLGYIQPGHEDDLPPRLPPMTLRRLYDTMIPLLTTISEQLSRLLTLLEPGAGQPPARPKKRPPGASAQPC